jgi:hypothetical protein
MNVTKLLKALPVAVLLITFAAEGCEPEDGKANKAVYAGDGVTQFSDKGRLKFGITYRAHPSKSQKNRCTWEVQTINKDTGRVEVVGKGTYKNAKIRVAKPDTVNVFLKSDDCGLWKD